MKSWLSLYIINHLDFIKFLCSCCCCFVCLFNWFYLCVCVCALNNKMELNTGLHSDFGHIQLYSCILSCKYDSIHLLCYQVGLLELRFFLYQQANKQVLCYIVLKMANKLCFHIFNSSNKP